MKRCIFVAPVLFFAVALPFGKCFAQSKEEKAIQAAETIYETGDYKKAQASLDKFKKKAFKKLGAQNQYTATYHLLTAKYNLASGMLLDFESNLKTAINSSLSLNQENSQKHGLLLLAAGELYAQSGSFHTAKEFLNNSKNILEGGKFMTDAIMARWNVAMAEVLTGQGFYNESLGLLWNSKDYYSKRTAKQESFVDEKGNLKSRKIPEQEITQRLNDYARVLTLIGVTYGAQGALKQADEALVFATQWIQKNL